MLPLVTARRERQSSERAALIAEIFGGRPARRLPQTVVEALERLDAARSPHQDAS